MRRRQPADVGSVAAGSGSRCPAQSDSPTLLLEREVNEAPRDLLLSREQVLSKRVQLPLAAESNLRQALAFEMDRHTPFNAQAVYFDYQVLERDRERGQLHLDMVVAPRSLVDPLLEVLEPRGLAPTGVDVAKRWHARRFQPVAASPAFAHSPSAHPHQYFAGRHAGADAGPGDGAVPVVASAAN